MKEPIILAIESSCDDTSAAVISGRKILSNIIATQSIHEDYGGVVPELASREHQKNIIPVVDVALKRAGVELNQVDAIACTRGPGLMGSLLVGWSFAKSLAISIDKPLIGVHHMKAHILAHLIENEEGANTLKFPFLCLTVSGGHTQIVKVNDHDDMEVLGETIDDAAGEAFDKTAKILGLPYPGGPIVDRLAKEGNPNAYKLSKPKVEGLDFSFSGLKTGILYFLQKEMKKDSEFINNNMNDLCASIQKTIVGILIEKLKKASDETGIKQLCVAGGVSANSELRQTLKDLGNDINAETFIPTFQYCTDNAGMIAISAYFKYLSGQFDSQDLVPKARWPFLEKQL